MKILMVCLGNICRSPLAAGLLKHKVALANLPWQVASAGTSDWHLGSLPDKRSIKVAQQLGIDITNDTATHFKPAMFAQYDKIYVMDSSNYQAVKSQATNADEVNKINLIMNEIEPALNIAVPDPYWNTDGFENVYEMLDQATDAIIEKYN